MRLRPPRRGRRPPRSLGTSADRATYATLHTASLAAPALRGGLTGAGAARAAPHLRALLAAPALALTDTATVLAWDGTGGSHAAQAADHVGRVLATGRQEVLPLPACTDPLCPVRTAVVAPLVVEDVVVGALAAYVPVVAAGQARAVTELARWVSGQLELAELDRSRARAAEAEVRALRAQISPHFIYNALTAIASFVRTDPDRARELLVEFAEFTRYSFRRHGNYTTLAEELRSIDRYLLLERARFGERLQVTLQIAPEVLPVAVPFLCLQPLVENAVRHGLETRPGPGHITITAADAGAEAVISVEDDGVGMEPDLARRILAGNAEGTSVGLANVDSRLRQSFGESRGLVIETGVGAGTKVLVRVPKFAPGVDTRPTPTP